MQAAHKFRFDAAAFAEAKEIRGRRVIWRTNAAGVKEYYCGFDFKTMQERWSDDRDGAIRYGSEAYDMAIRLGVRNQHELA